MTEILYLKISVTSNFPIPVSGDSEGELELTVLILFKVIDWLEVGSVSSGIARNFGSVLCSLFWLLSCFHAGSFFKELYIFRRPKFLSLFL